MCTMDPAMQAQQQALKSMPSYSAGNNAAQKMKVTPQEQRIIDYHRNTIESGKVGKDEEGRPVTVYATGILVQEGPQKGKFVSVPAYVDGKIIRDENQLYKRWKSEIDSGKWPAYKSGQELNKRSVEIHQIMDMEESQAKGTKGFYEKSRMR